jgi:cell division protein FtsB/DNA-binding CsgD family transcriptional regulator
MEKRLLFDSKKEKKINNYKNIIVDTLLDSKTKFEITKKLIYELEYYSFDKALYYALENLKIAQKINDPQLIADSNIIIAKLLMESGRYKESLDILTSINRKQISSRLLVNYFYSLKEAYSELNYYSSIPKNKEKYFLMHQKYQDSLAVILPKNSDDFLRLKEKEYRDQRLLDKALKINSQRLKGKKSGTRDFSLITFERSLLYELTKNKKKEKKYLILSAISDIEASVKDNASLAKLAMILYEEKKIFKAHQFINFSLDDATFFNSKLRFINISSILPVITEAYEKESALQNKKLTQSLIFSTILVIVLLCTTFYIYSQVKKLSEARVELKKVNTKLKDVNNQLNTSNENLNIINVELLKSDIIKEKYIATFLNLYSDYINKLDIYRKLVKKYVALNRISELQKLTESKQVIDDEMKLFQKNFDESFLHIYPNFIQKFNQLLTDDKRIQVKKGELLNTELRIYALIRLGITNSEQIAKILRYSVSTIYNYRVKLKNNAKKDRDFFEDQVKQIS